MVLEYVAFELNQSSQRGRKSVGPENQLSRRLLVCLQQDAEQVFQYFEWYQLQI